jgi:hypothetical protein
LIHFDLDDRYQDEPLVGTAISRRESAVVSVVFHGLVLLALFFAPSLPVFTRTPEELQAFENSSSDSGRLKKTGPSSSSSRASI